MTQQIEPNISDYKGYDYKTDYWVKENRSYENTCEQNTIKRLINRCKNKETIVDIGCGFGRLFPSYHPYTTHQILIDYAQHLLDQAKKELQHTDNTTFIQGNMYDIPLEKESVDIALTIRTLHHITDTERFFKELHRILKDNGYAIIEIPNKRNLLTIIRFLCGKSKFNPFDKKTYHHGNTFVNFHPTTIYSQLNYAGFSRIKTLNTNFFRHPRIKQLIPHSILVNLDVMLQKSISFLNLSPSIILLLQKKT